MTSKVCVIQGASKKIYPISKLNFNQPIILMSNFIISHDSQNDLVNGRQSYGNFSEQPDFPLEHSMKFSLSKFHSLCFVSMTFSHSPYVSSPKNL